MTEANLLFRIATEKVELTFSRPAAASRALTLKAIQTGTLRIKSLREGSNLSCWRCDVQDLIAEKPDLENGPLLFEQTNYKLHLKSKGNVPVQFESRDPMILRELDTLKDESIIHGYINFGSQIGLSEFTILVEGKPEFEFCVEIFPSKLDYKQDYEEILSEVQEIMTGLALEYLRSTFRYGGTSETPQPTQIEWLTTLRHIVNDLERALQFIAQHPRRRIIREIIIDRAEKIKKADSYVRAAIRNAKGLGPLKNVSSNLRIPKLLPHSKAITTLDTPEHRWFANQLTSIQRRLAQLKSIESTKELNARRRKILDELAHLESRIVRLQGLEPIAAATTEPPSGFASMLLIGGPGYKEAYKLCLILNLGLRLEGGPMQLSVKDLNLLYEYWCYLAILRMVSEIVAKPIPSKEFFAVQQDGLRVLLQKGSGTAARFKVGERSLEVTFNRKFAGKSILINQQPDILISMQDPQWANLHLLVDAKYRVDASQEFVKEYKSPGPPEDSINTMFRYRDAILEEDRDRSLNMQPVRTVVQALAAFPFRVKNTGEYRTSELWKSLERIGVGAIPMLPGGNEYMKEWLCSSLQRGGWALSDKIIQHRGSVSALDWREAAAQAVLVGVLKHDLERKHFDWVVQNRIYYMPLFKNARKQFSTMYVALYSSRHQGGAAITHFAKVNAIDVRRRREIPTPWPATNVEQKLFLMFHLKDIQTIPIPIRNIGQRFSKHRWTSLLALRRAQNLSELFLETEPEWRLYEDLKANDVSFRLKSLKVMIQDPKNPSGRAWFKIREQINVRYAGADGFLAEFGGQKEKFTRLEPLLNWINQKLHTASI